jgi:hypothetical protein
MPQWIVLTVEFQIDGTDMLLQLRAELVIVSYATALMLLPQYFGLLRGKLMWSLLGFYGFY